MLHSSENQPAIVFVHGLLGWAAIRLPLLTIHYFRGLPENLKHLAAACYFPQLPRAGTVAERAGRLAGFLAAIPLHPVLLVGHSMGGLDCRYLASRLDPARRVRAVVTVATPHRGTPLADWFARDSSRFARLGRGITSPGLHELTTTACARFNREVLDRPDVRYLSYAGWRPCAEMPLLFRPWTRMLQEAAGDNDSQVPVSSAAWGELRGRLRADHLESAGWSLGMPNRRHQRPFDHLGLYQRIAREMLEEGR